MTLENWQDILFITFRTNVNKYVTSVYLISWIFLGNWILLNLFLAILLEGFSTEQEFEEEDENSNNNLQDTEYEIDNEKSNSTNTIVKND